MVMHLRTRQNSSCDLDQVIILLVLVNCSEGNNASLQWVGDDFHEVSRRIFGI